MGSKAFESPLISHARMRGLYRGLVEVRVLGERGVKRRGAVVGWPKNLEACWVATALDLKPADMTSVSQGWWLLEHIRALGERVAAEAATVAEVRYARRALQAELSAPSKVEAIDRMLGVVGMAIAAKKAGQQSVAVGYVGSDQMTAAEWKRLLNVGIEGALPLVFVVTPGGKDSVDVSAVVKRLGMTSVPVIPVDAGDAVAIYRVMQETLVRARADGGVAVIECVDCGTDPIATLGTQLVKKQICTERWVAGVETGFRARASKG